MIKFFCTKLQMLLLFVVVQCYQQQHFKILKNVQSIIKCFLKLEKIEGLVFVTSIFNELPAINCYVILIPVLNKWKILEPFQINTGVEENCLLSLVVYNVMKKTIGHNRRGIQQSLQNKLKDLKFASYPRFSET